MKWVLGLLKDVGRAQKRQDQCSAKDDGVIQFDHIGCLQSLRAEVVSGCESSART